MMKCGSYTYLFIHFFLLPAARNTQGLHSTFCANQTMCRITTKGKCGKCMRNREQAATRSSGDESQYKNNRSSRAIVKSRHERHLRGGGCGGVFLGDTHDLHEEGLEVGAERRRRELVSVTVLQLEGCVGIVSTGVGHHQRNTYSSRPV